MTSRRQGRHTGRVIPRKSSGASIQLSHLLGSGGEGEVYAVKDDPTLAVKIYHDNRVPEGAAARKLTAMENIEIDLEGVNGGTLPPLAWPKQVIKVRGEEKVAGMVMPLVDQEISIPLSHTLTPTVRFGSLAKRGISQAKYLENRWRIAQNLAAAVEAVHEAGCVIGDVNDENVLTNPVTGEISIVDCDTFQIMDRERRTIYRCKVGRPEYTPPELLAELDKDRCEKRCHRLQEEGPHKPNYSCLERLSDHDMFGVSVILFKLFMNGAHPYNQRSSSSNSGTSTLKDLIQQNRYPYNLNSAMNEVTPANAKQYRELPAELRSMFHKTFA